MIQFDTILKSFPDLSQYYDTIDGGTSNTILHDSNMSRLF
jgi:hypothetical protein